MNEKLLELVKRRGFFWKSFEIYGGVSGFIDFGPLGIKIMRKIENVWRSMFLEKHSFIYEINTPIVMPKIIFEASGHLKHFTDIVVTCKECKRKYRIDQIIEKEEIETWPLDKINEYIILNNIKCPECKGEFEYPSTFNLLMKTNIGPYSSDIGYMRPEAAQGIFINFKRIFELTGRKLPLGIVQIGKVQRNEISPRKGLFRMREFTIIDLEIFYDHKNPSCEYIKEIHKKHLRILTLEERKKGNKFPKNILIEEILNKEIIKNEWLAYFMYISQEFLNKLGINYEKQFFIEKFPEERAHYSSQTFDQIVIFSDGTQVEVSGHSLRTDYDLKGHSIKSGINLYAERIEKGKVVEKYFPYVVEPSFGLERILLAVLDNSYSEKNKRIILKFNPQIAPYEVAILPLVKKNQLPEYAYKIYNKLKSEEKIDCIYDDSEYIGKLYAKYDEIGVPFCITIDYQTLNDNTVTIRDRNSWSQIRIKVEELSEKIKKLINQEIKFEEAGKIIKKFS